MKDKKFHTVFVVIIAAFLFMAGLRQAVQVFASSDDSLILQYYTPDMPVFDPAGLNWAMSDRISDPFVRGWDSWGTYINGVYYTSPARIPSDSVVLLDHSLYCAKVRNNTAVDVLVGTKDPKAEFLSLLNFGPEVITFAPCDSTPNIVEDTLSHPELVVYADTGEYIEKEPVDTAEGDIGYTPLLGVPQSTLAVSSDLQTGGDQEPSLVTSEPSIVSATPMPSTSETSACVYENTLVVNNPGLLCTIMGVCFAEDLPGSESCQIGPCGEGQELVGACSGEKVLGESGGFSCLGSCAVGVWMCCQEFPVSPPPPSESGCAQGQELVNGLCLGPWSEKQPDANTYCRPSCVWGTPLCRDIAGRLQATGVVLGENETAEVIEAKCFYDVGWTWGDWVSECPVGSDYRVCIRNGNDGTGGAYWIGVKSASPPQAEPPPPECPAGHEWDENNGVCVDIMSDPANCGGIGVVCPADQVCFEGTCVDWSGGSGIDWADIEELMDSGINWTELDFLSRMDVNWAQLDLLSGSGINWGDWGGLNVTGVNWTDIEQLINAGFNWTALDLMSQSGINWMDIDSLIDMGINWSDIGMLMDSGLNWSDLAGLTQSGTNWVYLELLSHSEINWGVWIEPPPPECPAGHEWDENNGVCVDIMSDPANCGSVGNLCGADQVCTSGSCVIHDPCDGTPAAGTVCSDGLVFVAAGLRTTAGNGPPLKWQAAMDYCASLNGGDMGEGWQLPSLSDLRTLFINRNILGGFTKDSGYWNYWSSKVYYTSSAGYVDFATGYMLNFASKNFTFNVRCVRRE